MNYFNVIAGVASIISLLFTICVYKGVNKIIVNMRIEDKSVSKVNQRAKGENISQVGGDKNG